LVWREFQWIIVPEFPAEAKMILLTESAKFDPLIVEKIKAQLIAGKNVMMTSGLLRALEGKGIEDIVELRYTDGKITTKEFVVGWQGDCLSKEKVLIPQIQYLTNDSWEDISCIASGTGSPILHQARYANGSLFVLTIPDNFGDLYNFPPEVLNRIRSVLSQDINVRIEGPAQVGLFVYDNGTFIVESFLPENVNIKIITRQTDHQTQEYSYRRGIYRQCCSSCPDMGEGKRRNKDIRRYHQAAFLHCVSK
jgi:hypothetical protein